MQHSHLFLSFSRLLNRLLTMLSLHSRRGAGSAALTRLTCLLLVACVLMLAHAPDALHAYRKPPFNGSIFGKRSEPEAAGRTLAALCEVAAEACSVWFPGPPGEAN
ncbi:hypothetical protein B566_EDAN015505 [Ephemera danica]|nr:hypothetical protein B566_EDAN015505 [Ephemera danica]